MATARDEGSATVWVLGLAVLLVGCAWVTLLVTTAAGVRHRAEAAADLAALAAAAAAQDGRAPCEAAAEVASANGGRVVSCLLAADQSVLVRVVVDVPPALARWADTSVSATARAGVAGGAGRGPPRTARAAR